MTESQKIELRRSKVRQRLAEISKLSGDTYTAEVKTEESGLQDEYGGLEIRFRSAVIADTTALDDAKGDAGEPDAEKRERVELRSKVSVARYFHGIRERSRGGRRRVRTERRRGCGRDPDRGVRTGPVAPNSATPSTAPSLRHRAPSGSTWTRSVRPCSRRASRLVSGSRCRASCRAPTPRRRSPRPPIRKHSRSPPRSPRTQAP